MKLGKPYSNYREKLSHMISWGHWFALFNIFIALILGVRYLFLIDWPSSLYGRIYAISSWLGHFSFIVFAVYLLILFPLTFVLISQKLVRTVAIILATLGNILLLTDAAVFDRFHLHLNPVVWELVVNPEQTELARDWQIIFIAMPVIFLLELLFSTWSWQKLRSLNRQKFAKPLAVVFVCAFVATHIAYIWADANFYRPITMQRANLPLSYPMTARRFLEKHGWFNEQAHQQRIMQQGAPEALSVEYPLSSLNFDDKGSGYNLLIINVDGLRANDFGKDLPNLANFAQQNLTFSNHYSTGNNADKGLFGLFYGISPTYSDSILAGHKSSALVTALIKQGYQFGLFSSNGFNLPLYRHALFGDFSLSAPIEQSDNKTYQQWQEWLTTRTSNTPWFSYLNFDDTDNALTKAERNLSAYSARYRDASKNVDGQINAVITTLQQQNMLDHTVVVITASHGIEMNDTNKNSWGAGSNYSRYQLQVPLVIHWPNMPPQTVSTLTSHQDIMATLMLHLLHVSNSPKDYTQGNDLFITRRNHDWLSLGDTSQLVVITNDYTFTLERNGRYHFYDDNNNELKKDKPPLTLLLEVLTDLRRFIDG